MGSIFRQKGFVYLLHFEEKYGHCQHYLGWASKGGLKNRIQQHRDGIGSKLTIAFYDAGIPFRVARVWRHATKLQEKRIRDKANNPKLCPICAKEGREVTPLAQRCNYDVEYFI